MEQLINNIRESEQKNNHLAETLLKFNESFNEFMLRLEETTNIKDLSRTYEHIESLKETIEGIKEDIEVTHAAQMGRINHLEQDLKKVLEQEMMHYIHEIVDEKMKKHHSSSLQANSLQQSKMAITLNEEVYVIGQDKKHILKYNHALASSEVVYETENEISEILYSHGQIFVYHKEGELCTLKHREILSVKGKELRLVAQGIISLSDEKELVYYNMVLDELKVIDQNVEAFEIIENNRLLYQAKDGIKSKKI